jgi:dienelactone hydrolase
MKNMPMAKARFMAAYDVLKQQPTVDPGRIAAIGYCFGGGVVLYMAREGADLKGVASFHGMLATMAPAKPGVMKAKLLVLTGDDDKFVPPDQVAKFEQEMKNAGVDFQLLRYPGAKHAFTNPEADVYAKKFDLPLGYNAQADKQSWAELQKFLTGIFKK